MTKTVEMMVMILLTDNDVYTVAEQAQTGIVLLVALLLAYILLLFSDAIRFLQLA